MSLLQAQGSVQISAGTSEQQQQAILADERARIELLQRRLDIQSKNVELQTQLLEREQEEVDEENQQDISELEELTLIYQTMLRSQQQPPQPAQQ